MAGAEIITCRTYPTEDTLVITKPDLLDLRSEAASVWINIVLGLATPPIHLDCVFLVRCPQCCDVVLGDFVVTDCGMADMVGSCSCGITIAVDVARQFDLPVFGGEA